MYYGGGFMGHCMHLKNLFSCEQIKALHYEKIIGRKNNTNQPLTIKITRNCTNCKSSTMPKTVNKERDNMEY